MWCGAWYGDGCPHITPEQADEVRSIQDRKARLQRQIVQRRAAEYKDLGPDGLHAWFELGEPPAEAATPTEWQAIADTIGLLHAVMERLEELEERLGRLEEQ